MAATTTLVIQTRTLLISDNNNSGQGTRPFGSNGPSVQFGVQQGPLTSFGRGNGYNTSPPYPMIGRSLTATEIVVRNNFRGW